MTVLTYTSSAIKVASSPRSREFRSHRKLVCVSIANHINYSTRHHSSSSDSCASPSVEHNPASR